MNTKQKLGYMLVGGAIVVIAMLIGVSISPLMARHNHFSDVTCTNLTVTGKIRCTALGVVDKDERTILVALGSNENGGMVGVYDKATESSGTVSLQIDSEGGALLVSGEHGKIGILSDEEGGILLCKGSTGEVRLSVDEEFGGLVRVAGEEGVVHLHGDGSIETHDKDGKVTGSIP